MKKKQKKVPEPLNLRKEVSRLPGYIICFCWVLFTFVLISWVILASFSTTREIINGELFAFATGFHFENYVTAWNTQKMGNFFLNSLFYTFIAGTLLIFVAAPAAYALARFQFKLNGLLQSMFATALGIPVVMIIMPLFSLAIGLDINNTRGLIMYLYVAMNVPFSLFFLNSFFKNLSLTFEEAAAIDGCSPIKTFWKIMMPLAQPGIVTVSIFNFMAIWNEFFMSNLFAGRSNIRPIAVGLYNIVIGMQYTNDYGGLFAACVIVLLYVILSDKVISGITGGAIKG